MTQRRLYLFDGDDRRFGSKGWALVDEATPDDAADVSDQADDGCSPGAEAAPEVAATRAAAIAAVESERAPGIVEPEDPQPAGARRRRRPSPVRDPPPGGQSEGPSLPDTA